MPLNPQEERAILLILPTLDTLWGASWSLPSDRTTLDDLHPSKPTPECVISNESITAAPEVKQLFGDASTRDYFDSQRSLYRRLAPPYGGRYSLYPCFGVTRPLPEGLLRCLKKEIEEAGKHVPLGGSTVITVPRTGLLQRISDEGHFVYCGHTQTADAMTEVGPHVTGTYFLDETAPSERWEHSFIGDKARDEFYSTLIEACALTARGQPIEISWSEEWKLTRSDGEDGVFVAGMVTGWMLPGVQEEMQRALDAASKKFDERWADRHVVVLERKEPSNATVDHIKEVGPRLNLPENVDLVLLVDGDEVSQLFLRERRS